MYSKFHTKFFHFIMALSVLLMTQESRANSVVKRIRYEGVIYMGAKWSDYTLLVTFSDGPNQNIRNFKLSINGKLIAIPDKNLSLLKQVNRVDTPVISFRNADTVKIKLYGGDGAKSYQVDIIANENGFVDMIWNERPKD